MRRGPGQEGRIAEFEQYQAVDVEKMTLATLLDHWLEATWGETRVASDFRGSPTVLIDGRELEQDTEIPLGSMG